MPSPRKIHMARTATDAVANCGARTAIHSKEPSVTRDWNQVSCKTCLGWEGSSFQTNLPPAREKKTP